MPAQSHEQIFEKFSQVSQKLAQDFFGGLTTDHKFELNEIYQSLTAGIAHEADHWNEIQAKFYQKQMELWMSLLKRQPDEAPQPIVEPARGDRRFHGAEWKEYPFFDFLKQYYLLTSNWMTEMVESARLDPQAKKKLAFFTRQYLDAMCPANFPVTNPEALKLAAETEGESMLGGLKNFLADLEKGRISMTDESAFEVGREMALTPGAVVFENDLIQLIQYSPLTGEVYERPLLIVPPFINKYYILDLQPENSFVRYCLEQGHTVFLISWRNIPPELGATTWDDYIEQGVFKALDVTLEISGAKQANTLGFCVGGTLLSSALSVLSAKKLDKVASLTLLTTMLDFSDTGEISVYVDEAYAQKKEQDHRDGGLLHGKELAMTFASLRANELIWFYVVNNYLKGKSPAAFDLLYWNSDSSNLPGKLYAWYVRNLYLENNLRVPGKLTMCGVPVDLGGINLPAYILATKEDHIVPWKSAYASASLLKGKIEFVLAASGHIAGVVNPASKNKRNYWANEKTPADPEQWVAEAQSVPGSWWNHWSAWLKGKSSNQVPAPASPGSEKYPVVEPAPGRYVKVRFN